MSSASWSCNRIESSASRLSRSAMPGKLLANRSNSSSTVRHLFNAPHTKDAVDARARADPPVVATTVTSPTLRSGMGRPRRWVERGRQMWATILRNPPHRWCEHRSS